MERLKNTHLVRVPCVGCKVNVLATPEQAHNARCSPCWLLKVDEDLKQRAG